MSAPVNWQAVADAALGTCDSPSTLIERLDLDCDVEALEERLLDNNVERCPGCEWWVESGELADDEGEPQSCDNCRS